MAHFQVKAHYCGSKGTIESSFKKPNPLYFSIKTFK
jgi:hypothetical protein